MQQKVTITGLDTAKIPVLSKKNCKKYLLEYKNGNTQAKEKLVVGNLKLVLSVLKKCNIPSRIDINDVFQIGCIGLIKAIDNFNLEMDVSFSTYAIPMILGEIKRYLRDSTPLKISRQIKDVAYKVLKCKEAYLAQYSKEPSVEELANLLHLEEKEIFEAMNSINTVVSIFDPIYSENGESISIIDQLSDDVNYSDKIANYATLKEGIQQLSHLQKKIIQKRYYDGLTQFEIANELSISQAQVSRLEKSAIQELKKRF